MGAVKNVTSDVLHLSIIKGSLMQKSSEANPEAVKREWKDDSGNVKFKWEVPYSKVSGMITNVEFKLGDFGEQVIISLSDADEDIKIYMPTDSRYFSDFAKKLPNIDLQSEVEVMPYDFEGDKGKNVKGMSVKQNKEKVYSHYYDADKKKTINGLPQPDPKEKKNFDTDDWKIFFMTEKKFLKKAVSKVDFSLAKVKAEVRNVDLTAEVGKEEVPF